MDAESDDPKPERFCEYDDLIEVRVTSVSNIHLRAHETKANLVCRLLLEQ